MDRDLSRPRFCFTQVKWGGLPPTPLHGCFTSPGQKQNTLLVTTTCTVVGAGSHSLGDKIRTPTRPPVLSCPVLSRPSEIRPFSVSKKKPSRSSVSCTVKREECARLTTCAGHRHRHRLQRRERACSSSTSSYVQ